MVDLFQLTVWIQVDSTWTVCLWIGQSLEDENSDDLDAKTGVLSVVFDVSDVVFDVSDVILDDSDSFESLKDDSFKLGRVLWIRFGSG